MLEHPDILSLSSRLHGMIERAYSPCNLHHRAKNLLEFRRHRDAIFGNSLFGEPAWDVLLDLFVSDTADRPVSISAACIASAVPYTTALRYLGELQKYGLIRSDDDVEDRRRKILKLTSLGRERITMALSRSI